MALIVRIALNNEELRCYSIRRITHTDQLKPHGWVCQYEIRECYSEKHMGDVYHHYDDEPEKLVWMAMVEIVMTLRNKE